MAISGVGGQPQGDRNQMKQVFQEAKTLAPSNQQVAQDLANIQAARAQMKSQHHGDHHQGGETGQLSEGAQGIAAAGPPGVQSGQRQQMHQMMAPLMAQLTQDVEAAMANGGTDPSQQQQQAPQLQ